MGWAGRTLVSAGGDGSLRLWDTKAVGLLLVPQIRNLLPMVTRVHCKKNSLVHAAQLATSIATQCSEIQTFIFGMLKVWEIIRRILSLQRWVGRPVIDRSRRFVLIEQDIYTTLPHTQNKTCKLYKSNVLMYTSQYCLYCTSEAFSFQL
jgi:hypothetical protein